MSVGNAVYHFAEKSINKTPKKETELVTKLCVHDHYVETNYGARGRNEKFLLMAVRIDGSMRCAVPAVG